MIVQAMMLQALGPEELFRLLRIKAPAPAAAKTARPPARPTRLVPAFAARD